MLPEASHLLPAQRGLAGLGARVAANLDCYEYTRATELPGPFRARSHTSDIVFGESSLLVVTHSGLCVAYTHGYRKIAALEPEAAARVRCVWFSPALRAYVVAATVAYDDYSSLHIFLLAEEDLSAQAYTELHVGLIVRPGYAEYDPAADVLLVYEPSPFPDRPGHYSLYALRAGRPVRMRSLCRIRERRGMDVKLSNGVVLAYRVDEERTAVLVNVIGLPCFQSTRAAETRAELAIRARSGRLAVMEAYGSALFFQEKGRSLFSINMFLGTKVRFQAEKLGASVRRIHSTAAGDILVLESELSLGVFNSRGEALAVTRGKFPDQAVMLDEPMGGWVVPLQGAWQMGVEELERLNEEALGGQGRPLGEREASGFYSMRLDGGGLSLLLAFDPSFLTATRAHCGRLFLGKSDGTVTVFDLRRR